MTKWTTADIPDQAGRVFVVTGANSGLGFETVVALAQRGAQVVMACRSAQRAEAARDAALAQVPTAQLDLIGLDLASLASVREFSAEFHQRYDRLDVLVNNAGVMTLPYRKTVDGFEMQIGINHFGHFALTGLLLEKIMATKFGRIVTVSSVMHRFGKLNFDDLMSERRYDKWGAYSQSKLANLLFMNELQRKLTAAGANTVSAAAHPGYASTSLQTKGPDMAGSRFQQIFYVFGNKTLAQSAAAGAWPQLYAAVAPDVNGGDYFGPGGLFETRGFPKKVGSTAAARNEADAARLWEISEQLTGVVYGIG